MTWLQRIEAALQIGEFTLDDKTLVGAWNTCAVGENLVPRLGLHYMAEVIDKRIWSLGMSFCVAVDNDYPEEAMLLYKEIQEKI